MISATSLPLLLLAGCAALAQPGAGFTVVGVATAQTARINVINEAPGPGPSRDPQPVLPYPVILQFYGADGSLLKEKTVDDLAPDRIAFLDLSAAARPAGERRTPVRAVARFGCAGGANPPRGTLEACRVFPSLEIFDTDSGKAELVIAEARPLPSPALDPP